MKKNILTALLAAFAVVFFGCESDKGNVDLGPAPDDGSSYTDNASGTDLGDPEAGHGDFSNAKWGKFSSIRFDTDSASIRSSDRATLNEVGDYLNNNPSAKVLVAGNCDERGTAEYNRALGQRRAQAARTYLTKKGISADRISTVSYGEDKPVGSFEQNRRDDFGIVD